MRSPTVALQWLPQRCGNTVLALPRANHSMTRTGAYLGAYQYAPFSVIRTAYKIAQVMRVEQPWAYVQSLRHPYPIPSHPCIALTLRTLEKDQKTYTDAPYIMWQQPATVLFQDSTTAWKLHNNLHPQNVHSNLPSVVSPAVNAQLLS